jgi:hypothetical protein
VLGNDPLGVALDETVRNEFINQHPVVIARFNSVDKIGTCHVLYLAGSELDEHLESLVKLQKRPILTVSDNRRFLYNGGMIQLRHIGDNLRFSINREAAERTGLVLSSKLLRLAVSVTNGGRTN